MLSSQPLLQLARFGLVGILATVVHYAIALVSTWFASPYVANVAGYCLASLVSYFGHQRFTFMVAPEQRVHGRHFPRFIIASVAALGLSQLVLAGTQAAGLRESIGLAIAVLSVPPVTFLLHRFWVFD